MSKYSECLGQVIRVESAKYKQIRMIKNVTFLIYFGFLIGRDVYCDATLIERSVILW